MGTGVWGLGKWVFLKLGSEGYVPSSPEWKDGRIWIKRDDLTLFLSPMSPTSQRLSLEAPSLPLRSWHPWNKTKQKQEALPLPSSTSCCTQLYRQPLPSRLLRRIVHMELQEADGDCHLQAVVLHLARRSVCVHPQNRSLARWLERQGKRLQGTVPSLNLVLQKKMYSNPQQQN